MTCRLCSNDPCLCGDAYKSLTKYGYVELLDNLQKLGAEYNLHVDITIDELNPTSWLANEGVSISTGLLSKAQNLSDIPKVYYSKLKKYIGMNAVVFGTKHIDEIEPMFPILAYIYATGGDISRRRLRKALVEIYYSSFVGKYEFAVVLNKTLQNVVNSINGDAEFSAAVWKFIGYCRHQFSGASQLTDIGEKLIKGISIIEELTSGNIKQFFHNAIKLLWIASDLKYESEIIVDDMISNWSMSIEDMNALYGVDYSFVVALQNETLVSNWVL